MAVKSDVNGFFFGSLSFYDINVPNLVVMAHVHVVFVKYKNFPKNFLLLSLLTKGYVIK